VHLELVETIENVARAKAELIDELRPGATAVVPEEPLLDPYLTRDDIEIVRVDQSRELPFATGYTAAHQLLNTRTALTVVEVLGLPVPEGELQVEFSKLREEEVPLPGGGLLLNDCYNANPVSMRAALAHLDERAGAHRRLAVLGEMAELGDYAAEGHREVAAAIAEIAPDVVIAVGPLARAYGGRSVPDREAALELLREELRPGDCVLLKGARVLQLEQLVDELVPVEAS
jgi:UDP-N-acetylmuramoyl-tripeptide--D-alanyl-D-alanine ligase